MGLTPKYTKGDVAKRFAAMKRAIYQTILANLSYLGELCVNHARTVQTYHDQTGNLRNSIGYVIVHNGKVVRSGFTKSAPGSGSGLLTGRAYANQLASEIGSGWGLIVVAGMNYAASVESRGLDVLTSAEQLAETELPKLLAQLKADIARTAVPR